MRTTLKTRARLLGLVTAAAGVGMFPPGLAAQRAAPQPGLHRGRLLMNRLERDFAVYVPASATTGAPVVLALHGGSGGSGDRLRGLIGPDLEPLADRAGFLVAYPDGVGGNWNDCRAGASYSANLQNIDDPGFLRALVFHLRDAFGADPERVHAIGYSNGGHLAYRVALEAPGVLQSIAVFGANLPDSSWLDCRESADPLPVMIVNGTSDVINPFTGGEVILPDGTRLGRVRSAQATLAYFGGLAGYRGSPARRVLIARDGPADAWVEETGWQERGKPAVILYTIHGGGHTIPSARAEFPEYLGPVERRMHGMAAAIRFFGLR